MVLTGKPFVFCAGADVKEFPNATAELAREGSRAGHELFGRIRALPYPTVAAINGACLGGGVEIALHCSHRTISAAVRHFACPEVFLGIFPAWGGTQLDPAARRRGERGQVRRREPDAPEPHARRARRRRAGLRRPAARARRVRRQSIAFASSWSTDGRARPSRTSRTPRTSCGGRAARSTLDPRRRPARYVALDLIEGACSGWSLEEGYRARGGRGRRAPPGPARAGLALRVRPRRAAREEDTRSSTPSRAGSGRSGSSARA